MFTPDMHVHHSLIFTLIRISDTLDLHIQVYDCYILLIRYLGRSLCITRSRSSLARSSISGIVSYLLLFCWVLL